MRKIVFVIPFLFCGCSLHSVYVKSGYPQSIPAVSQDSIAHSIFFIGDAGEPLPDDKEKTLHLLTSQASVNSANNTIIFLGDNIYPAGMPDSTDSDRSEMERRINEQVAVAEKSNAQTIFIPGNHDWQRGGSDGLTTLKRQEQYIKSKNLLNVSFLPFDGYPGPSVVDIGSDIRIIILDTQWWLHEYEKPFYSYAQPEEETKKIFLDSLSRALTTGRRAIVAAHHPLETHGQHGGFFDWTDHILPLQHIGNWLWVPLPGIGSLYPLFRMWGNNNQDLSGEKYEEMKMKLDSVLVRYQPVAYVSGHEHTLQVLKSKGKCFYLISGYGIETHSESLTAGDNTIFARLAPGFMRLDFLTDGSIRLGVIEAAEDSASDVEVFSMKLR